MDDGQSSEFRQSAYASSAAPRHSEFRILRMRFPVYMS